MPALLKDLVPDFREKCEELLTICKANGQTYVPYFTLRSPKVQARLWRQSRSTATIRATIGKLRIQEAHFLADCIEEVGPQNGKPVTNALPGMSWHQYGEAMDVFLLNADGTENWSTREYIPLVRHARELGLTPGPVWDSGHIQLRSGSPLSVFGDMKAVDEQCRERWHGRDE